MTQGCHVLPFVQLRYSNLYLEGRNPAAGEEKGGKSLSVQLGKHKFKGPDHVKTFCSQTRGGFGGVPVWPKYSTQDTQDRWVFMAPRPGLC